MTWKQKLNPGRFSGMSPKMGAIIACILDIEMTTPAIESMIVTSDGFVLAQLVGDIGYIEFIGSEDDLLRNFNNLVTAAKLTPIQKRAAHIAYVTHVRRA